MDGLVYCLTEKQLDGSWATLCPSIQLDRIVYDSSRYAYAVIEREQSIEVHRAVWTNALTSGSVPPPITEWQNCLTVIKYGHGGQYKL